MQRFLSEEVQSSFQTNIKPSFQPYSIFFQKHPDSNILDMSVFFDATE